MPPRYNIYKLLPSTGEKVPLHERVPEQLSEWLCKICELEMKPTDRDKGFLIIKESISRPMPSEMLTNQAS